MGSIRNGKLDHRIQSSALDPVVRISPRGQAALRLLLEAYEYASELSQDVWDFAVEIDSLRQAGVTVSGFRWLVCKGLVEHAREITAPGDPHRTFHPEGRLKFARRSCFVMTAEGVGFARETLSGPTAEDPTQALARLAESGTIEKLVPTWDRDRQELRLGGVVVKQFKVPALNQEIILAAFEEEGWPVRIDDPLPPRPKQDPKRRLHDTINSLNRNQKHRLLRFLGDGSGQGVRWNLALPAGYHPPAGTHPS
jgi:hypothetical protein